jgi:uncharacterized protein YndB with AHSA1/START domain
MQPDGCMFGRRLIVFTLTAVPSVEVGLLIRREPAAVFRALVEPDVTSRIWFSRSSGPVVTGAALRWDWEMYGVGSDVHVEEVEEPRRVRFTWSGYTPEHPTTVEFTLVPWPGGHTHLTITETGFTGDGDELVRYATDSTAGFTFLLASLKALLEHDLVLGLVVDAHPQRAG